MPMDVCLGIGRFTTDNAGCAAHYQQNPVTQATDPHHLTGDSDHPAGHFFKRIITDSKTAITELVTNDSPPVPDRSSLNFG